MQQIMGVFESSYDFIQEENMREIIQLVVSFTGSLGFAALFNIHGKKIWFAALGGCLSWAVYLAVEFITPSPYVCGFWSTVAITLYAECMARIHKTPVTVFLVSATIPLIPGAALYRTMNWMLIRPITCRTGQNSRKTESIRSFLQ